ncbi:helix-turn-helix transcriptional regulator [Pseudoxanthomonas koreensis]|uniref:helix-turn-helix transcriptional regulator n=1 Tax=Pseudoxanthomonas koreensis TaxID=266061 RepID=UPI0013908183|nr:helix-turn-helix transcriptional regulator [Pseudoxanthomonas koreensis]KAF1690756.1 XRE family transcriptional regulator [Pseudoxanthomonas koreensis]
MAKRTPPSHPRAQRQILALGQRLRAARMRRSMTQEVMAERVGVSTPTLAKLENGDPSTSMATVLRVLTVLGLDGDIDLIASQDLLGRELQDNALRRTNAAPAQVLSSRPAPPARTSPPHPPPAPVPSRGTRGRKS